MHSVRLIQFTDTHLTGDAAATVRGMDTLASLRTIVASAAQRFARPDGVLLTGDLVDEDPAGYRFIRQVFDASPVPVLCVPGNHDLPEQMRATLADAPFQVGGVKRFGRWTIVMLDTWLANSAAGRLGPEQLQQLQATLSADRNQHVLLCMHHHPILMRSQWLDTVGIQDADALLTLIHQHSNVRGVLWGHVHQSLDSFIDGVRFMATPSTCAQFLPESDDFALDSRPPGYRMLELLPDGAIATEVVWLENYAARRGVA
ncbi:MAG TPA: phosphodiesterase [Steroidobacteraceae bacterium]|jgi:Icc protein